MERKLEKQPSYLLADDSLRRSETGWVTEAPRTSQAVAARATDFAGLDGYSTSTTTSLEKLITVNFLGETDTTPEPLKIHIEKGGL
ncbi:hypothetical protein [Dongshaea marina]|uniref:hypothetical protein n=1 Tax=Dongshaea marina TaxID=2047966 RepID=UPI000D3E9DAE|nr:hypothetical protein [Dongshaea marina]